MSGPEPVEKIIERLRDPNGAVDVGSVLDALKAAHESAPAAEKNETPTNPMSLVRVIERMHADGVLPEGDAALASAEVATALDTARGVILFSHDALVEAVTEHLAALDRLDPDRVWGDEEDNAVAAELRRMRGLLEALRDELQEPVDRLRSFVARIEAKLPPE